MSNNFCSSIVKSIKEGSFGFRIQKRLSGERRIKNRYAKRVEGRYRVYKKLQKEYGNLLEQDIPAGESEPSNYVWICWFQGIEKAPSLVKACVNSVKRNLKGREIVILTEETIPQYVEFPDYIQDKWKKGMIGAAHYSDLLRTELLCRYGGMWIDATVLCTANEVPAYISNEPLFVYKQLDLSRCDDTRLKASSWFISAHKNHPIMLKTRELLYAYWKDYNYLIDYFLFHIFFAMSTGRYKENWDSIPVFNNHSPHVLQFELDRDYSEERWKQILSMSCFHKLNRYHSFADKPDSFYMHIIRTFGEVAE